MKSTFISLCAFVIALPAFGMFMEFSGNVKTTSEHHLLRCRRADFREAKALAFRDAETNGFANDECRVYDKDAWMRFGGGNPRMNCRTTIRCNKT